MPFRREPQGSRILQNREASFSPLESRKRFLRSCLLEYMGMQTVIKKFLLYREAIIEQWLPILSVTSATNLVGGDAHLFEGFLDSFMTFSEEHGFIHTGLALAKLKGRYLALTKEQIRVGIKEVEENFRSECWGRSVYVMREYEGHLFNASFSPEIDKAFPDATDEIREANSCYALDRHTACVFHCCRAVEHGIRAVMNAVGGSRDPKPLEYQEWQSLIDQIDSKWKDIETRSEWRNTAELRNARGFFKRLVADMHAFKDDVRIVTMHSRKSYDRPGAKDVKDRTERWFTHMLGRINQEMLVGSVLDKTLFAPSFLRL